MAVKLLCLILLSFLLLCSVCLEKVSFQFIDAEDEQTKRDLVYRCKLVKCKSVWNLVRIITIVLIIIVLIITIIIAVIIILLIVI